MFNKTLKRVIMISMAAILVLAINPVSVMAGEITKAAIKPVANKQLQENITKGERQIKTLKNDVLDQIETTSTNVEDELLPLILDVAFTLADNDLELDDDVNADIDKRAKFIENTINSINDNLDAIDNYYKKAQGIKKKNPAGYLKELQKIVDKYNTIKKQLTNLDNQIDELTTILNDISDEINTNTDGDVGDNTDNSKDDAILDNDQLKDAPSQPAK